VWSKGGEEGRKLEGFHAEQVFGFHRDSWMHSHDAGPVIPVRLKLENWKIGLVSGHDSPNIQEQPSNG